MKKTVILVGAAIVLIVAGLRLLPARPKDAMSFLVIVVDSMRADHLGAYGYARPTSRAIDAIGRDGVVFENAYSQAPWTRPSVASLFTSSYIEVHRVLFSERIVDGEERSDVLNEKFLTLAEAMKSGGFATGGFGKKIHLQPEFGFSQGFDGYDMDARRAEKVNAVTLSWLRSRDPDKFFIYLHYNDPHYPYTPRPGHSTFGATSPRVQINGETKRAFRDGALDLSPADIRDLVDLYDGEIAATDAAIRDLIRAIEGLGYRNLLVIVTADHGEEFLDHGDITHGQSLYNELVRVPFIVGGSAMAQQARGRRVTAPVQLIDVMPTLIDLAGMPEPPGLQGRSIAPLLRGAEAIDQREIVFTQRRDPGDPDFSSAVTDGRWKLIKDAVRDEMMLFDLRADPGENLLIGDVNPDLVHHLIGRISGWSSANQALYETIRPDDTTPLDPETEQRLRSLGYIN